MTITIAPLKSCLVALAAPVEASDPVPLVRAVAMAFAVLKLRIVASERVAFRSEFASEAKFQARTVEVVKEYR